MKTVRKLVLDSHRPVWTISVETTVEDALILMEEKNVSAVPVLAGIRLVGVVTERDFIRRLFTRGGDPWQVRAANIMTHALITVVPEDTVDACMALMIQHHIRHLLVLQDECLLGIVSMRDIVADLLAEKDFIIQQMHNYITGAYSSGPQWRAP